MPPVPSDANYGNCRFVPQAVDFHALDSEDGIPFIVSDAKVVKAATVQPELSTWRLVSTGITGLYDMVLAGFGTMAINLDGVAILANASSGSGYIKQGGQTYISSIFSYGCDGRLYTGIPGTIPFELGIDGNGKL
jgi:hypothetical protein